MKEIPLANGKGVALVDDEDWELVNQYKWRVKKPNERSRTIYAQADTPMVRGIRGKSVFMHRLLCPQYKEVDHINGNGLDNRKENLREVTRSQNSINTRNRQVYRGKPVSCKYRGVSRSSKNRWRAQIMARRQWLDIGQFDSPEAAAHAYDEFALRLHGEFARLNFPRTLALPAEPLDLAA